MRNQEGKGKVPTFKSSIFEISNQLIENKMGLEINFWLGVGEHFNGGNGRHSNRNSRINLHIRIFIQCVCTGTWEG